MLSRSILSLIATAASFASASPTGGLGGLSSALNTRSTPSSSGTNNGYYYSWWTDGASECTYTNGDAGSYSVNWAAGGNLVGGKGWLPGTDRSIQYTANWQPVNNGNSYLTIYGWTRSPLIEYYVVEAHGEYDPGSAATAKGSVTYDGSEYKLYQATRTNAPSIDGTQTFQQYWAIRQSQRTSGTVDFGVFIDAWANAGMTLGTEYNYQIVATEAYNSAGSSSVQVLSSA